MCLRGNNEIHGTAAPLGCQVRRLYLRCGAYRGFHGVRLWADDCQLKSSDLHAPERIDQLMMMIAIDVLVGTLQGYALRLAGLRRQVDPHWKRGMRVLRIGLAALQMAVDNAKAMLMAWLPIPFQKLEPCIPSRRARRK